MQSGVTLYPALPYMYVNISITICVNLLRFALCFYVLGNAFCGPTPLCDPDRVIFFPINAPGITQNPQFKQLKTVHARSIDRKKNYACGSRQNNRYNGANTKVHGCIDYRQASIKAQRSCVFFLY